MIFRQISLIQAKYNMFTVNLQVVLDFLWEILSIA